MLRRHVFTLTVVAALALSGAAFADDTKDTPTDAPEKKGDTKPDSRAENDRKKKCDAAKEDLAKLITQEAELEKLKDAKLQDRRNLRRNIDGAKAWSGMPRHIQVQRRTDQNGNEYWYCPDCEGPEKSAIQIFHIYVCTAPGPDSVFHPESLPYYVEEFRFEFEILFTARKRKEVAKTFCGKYIPGPNFAVYSNWQLRDYYLRIEKAKLEQLTKELNGVVDQYIRKKKQVQEKRKENKRLCSRARLLISNEKETSPSPGQKPAIKCKGGKLTGKLDCVGKRIGGE